MRYSGLAVAVKLNSADEKSQRYAQAELDRALSFSLGWKYRVEEAWYKIRRRMDENGLVKYPEYFMIAIPIKIAVDSWQAEIDIAGEILFKKIKEAQWTGIMGFSFSRTCCSFLSGLEKKLSKTLYGKTWSKDTPQESEEEDDDDE